MAVQLDRVNDKYLFELKNKKRQLRYTDITREGKKIENKISKINTSIHIIYNE